MDDFSTIWASIPLISGLCNVLLDRLSSQKMKELLMGYDLTFDELSKVSSSLMSIASVIKDAQERQEVDSNFITWLDKVNHAAYDAEDLIDEIYTTALTQKMDNDTQSCPSEIAVSHGGIESRFLEVYQRLACLSEQIPFVSSSQQTSSFVDESKIYGREFEREQIVKFLKGGVSGEDDQKRLRKGKNVCEHDNIRVIVIVGMPGIGKTTLAHLIFNDPIVDKIFYQKKWICVPKVFDAVKVVSEFANLQSRASYNRVITEDLQVVQKNLRSQVAGKRILIILDDVCEISNAEWEKLLFSFKSASLGSTIIVTTRNEDIATMLRPIFVHKLQVLPDDVAWSFFKGLSFCDLPAAQNEKLESLGRKIMAKCGGLPIAVKTIGQLLGCSLNTNEWETIQSSNIWNSLSDKDNGFPPALLLSYYYLPAHLKRCFAYCSLFPKNYLFDKERLVLLWLAEGFIDKETNDSRRMEDVGNDYFEDLKARSFFQVSYSRKDKFVMHDLFHDLAVHSMRGLSFMLEPNVLPSTMEGPRHFSFMQGKYDSLHRCGLNVLNSGLLRTFLPIRTFPNEFQSYLSGEMLQQLMSLGYLRVLSLCGYKIPSIPSSIGYLKHLRYLDLSYSLIEGLPDTICDLINLQTLQLSGCERLRTLPSSFKNLIHLLHLDIHGSSIQEMPEEMGRLSCLRKLSDFVVGENRRFSIRELGNLNQLTGSLAISGLQNVDMADASAARLSEKPHLDELILNADLSNTRRAGKKRLKMVLDPLKPNREIRRLTVNGFEGDKLPSWMGDEAFLNLEVIRLVSCYCVNLPTLGHLPSLKQLEVERCFKLETLGVEFYGKHSASSRSFKSLATLKFNNLPQLKNWFIYDGARNFPCLQQLQVANCPELEGNFLSSELLSLQVLDIEKCGKLKGSLANTPNLHTLSLNDFGDIALTSLATLTCLTKLTLCWSGEVGRRTFATVQGALQHLAVMEILTILCGRIRFPLPQRSWCLPNSVRSISISGCLVDEVDRFISGCMHVQYLYIYHSGSVPLRFPAGHFQQLNYLSIAGNSVLQEAQIISEGDCVGLVSLYDLSIHESNSLMCFPIGLLAAENLTSLSFYYCSSLISLLPYGMASHFPSLKFVSIVRCPLSRSFPEDDLPPRLETLRLDNCSNIEILSDYLYKCTSLRLLDLSFCEHLHSFPRSGLPSSLRKLEIANCTKIVQAFVHGGLPNGVESFHYTSKGLIQYYTDWHLDSLSSLRELHILAPVNIDSFPADHSLPTSLTVLHISGFDNLRSINCRELQRITSLQDLEISNCKSLDSFSHGNLPQSLCRVIIKNTKLKLDTSSGGFMLKSQTE